MGARGARGARGGVGGRGEEINVCTINFPCAVSTIVGLLNVRELLEV